MTEHYPRVRHQGATRAGERLLVREVVRVVFYMRHDHHELAAGVGRALDVYMRAVGEGPDTICTWEDADREDLYPLDEDSWERIRKRLQPNTHYRFLDDVQEESIFFRRLTKRGFETCITLTGGTSEPSGYGFHYEARLPVRSPFAGSVSVLSATVPTEYLEEHGPGKVRELAMELASHLPFATGHAGLAFGRYTMFWCALRLLREEVFRYPGIDVRCAGRSDFLGTRVEGVHWLNFLGQPVLGELGGAAALRARLHSPETTVQELEGERAVVTLGKWPEAGDLTQGRDLPAYRELARVLEPYLEEFFPVMANAWRGYTEEEVRRWWRRFLD